MAKAKTGVSLQQISESTKISLPFLQAIVNGDFAKLPGGVFDRNYIRQYAAAAGVDERPILERYQRYRAEKDQDEVIPERSSVLRWLFS